MQLRSGRFKWLTPPISINEVLPNEMLEMILLKLETQDLLRCRAVSKLWKAFASPICRRRFVTLNLRGVFQNSEKTEALYDTFEGSSDLPWSACSLDVYKRQTTVNSTRRRFFYGAPLHYLNRKQLRRFVDAFGPNLRKLKLRGDNVYTILPSLTEMPNLEILISGISPMTKELRRACSGIFLELTKLKRLEIVIRSEAEVQLMEFLYKNSRNLRSVSVNFGPKYNTFRFEKLAQDALRRIINLISGIPSIALNLSEPGTVESFQTLSVPELKLKELECEMPEDHVVELEQFLTNNSNCLEKLIMKDVNRSGAAGPFRLPIFSKLKEMHLYCYYISTSDLTSSLHPFVSNQFPSLIKVMLEVPEYIDEEFTTVFGTVQFHSVKELTLDNLGDRDEHPNPMVFNWGHIFPNLVKLTLDGVTVESYPHIYEKMTKLEHLSLKVGPRNMVFPQYVCVLTCFFGDPNTIICGYPKNKRNRGTAQNRSLASLKNLKTLFLDFEGCRKEAWDYPESKVHLALLKLHRLDSLTFQNIEISTEVKGKLRDHHREVKVQTDF